MQKRYERIFKFYHLSMLRPGTCRFFLFFCSCMWREDSKHAVVFSFPRVAGDTATKCSWGFYCGPFCKTVRFSLLVITAAIQKERKDRGSVLSWFGLITSCRVGSSNGRALPQDADRVQTVLSWHHRSQLQ